MGRLNREWPFSARLLAAVCITAAAVFLRVWLPGDTQQAFATFSPAIVLCFLICGTLPGLAATAVSALLTSSVTVPPSWSNEFKPAGGVATLLFVLFSLAVGFIARSVRARDAACRKVDARQSAILENELLSAATMRNRRFVWANRGLERLIGCGPGELRGVEIRNHYLDEAVFQEVGEEAYPILAQGGSYRREVMLTRWDGTPIWVDLAGTRLDVGLEESLWLFTDITARKDAEAAAAASEGRYRQLAENANDVIATMAMDSTVLFINPAIEQVLGYSAGELVGSKTLSLTHPDDIPRVKRLFAAFVREGPNAQTLTYEFRVRHRDGSWRWLEGQPRIEFDSAGTPLRYQDVGRDVTARKLAEDALHTTASLLARTSQVAGIGGWEYTIATGALHWSDETCRLHDRPANYQPTLDEGLGYYTSEGRPVIFKAVRAAIDEGVAFDIELPIVSASGRFFHARVVGEPEFEAGKVVRLLGAFQDVSQRRALMRDLADSHELLKVTLRSIGDAVVTTAADGTVTWLNSAAERMAGWSNEDACGMPSAVVVNLRREEGELKMTDVVAECLALGRCVPIEQHAVLTSLDYKEHGIEGSASPLQGDNGILLGSVLVFHDVSEQRRFARELTYRATHDALTGLINRAEFMAQTALLLEMGSCSKVEHAILFIDLDQFKLVNDSCGHAGGDELLRQLSCLLRDSVRTTDRVARLGGDEFGIILAHCGDEQALVLARKICDEVDRFRFLYEGKRFRVGTSIGLVPISGQWSLAADLVKAADTACYAAKEAGRNRVHVWVKDDAAIESAQGQMKWVRRLQTAIDEDQFVLFAQRIEPVSGKRGDLHCEVLLRLQQADGSLVPPGRFLPAAERFYLATHIDRWVIRKVFAALEDPSSNIVPIERIAINLSGQSISDRSFHQDLLAMLAAAKFDITVLCLEITETSAITNLEQAKVFIDAVRMLGVHVALDDFGAGSSSFGYLKELAVDSLKIDGQFVRRLLEDRLDQVAVRCFVEVARAVGVSTVAEWVENEEVLTELQRLGIDMVQGYLLHQPERFSNLLHKDLSSDVGAITAGMVVHSLHSPLTDGRLGEGG